MPTNYGKESRGQRFYSAQRVDQWTNEEKSICRRCSKVGHIARNYRQNQPYQRPQNINNHGRYQQNIQRPGRNPWIPNYNSNITHQRLADNRQNHQQHFTEPDHNVQHQQFTNDIHNNTKISQLHTQPQTPQQNSLSIGQSQIRQI